MLDLCRIRSWFRRDDFFTGESNIVNRENSILARSNGLKLMFLTTCSFSLHTMLIDGLEWCDYLWIIVMFLSVVWTLILTAPIHCRWSIGEQVMECYISPNLMRNKLIYILDGLRVRTLSANLHFWMNYSFKYTCLWNLKWYTDRHTNGLIYVLRANFIQTIQA